MSVASAADNWRRPLAGTCRQRPSFSEFYRVIFFFHCRNHKLADTAVTEFLPSFPENEYDWLGFTGFYLALERSVSLNAIVSYVALVKSIISIAITGFYCVLLVFYWHLGSFLWLWNEFLHCCNDPLARPCQKRNEQRCYRVLPSFPAIRNRFFLLGFTEFSRFSSFFISIKYYYWFDGFFSFPNQQGRGNGKLRNRFSLLAMLDEFYWVLPGFRGFSLTWQMLDEFYCVLPAFLWLGRCWTEFYWVLLGFLGFSWVFLGFLRLDRYWTSFTGFYRVFFDLVDVG